MTISEERRDKLFRAVRQADVETVARILAEEPEIVELVDKDHTPLCFVAAKTGSLPLVKYLVEYSRASMNMVDEMDRNILHYAAISGDLELCQYLVEKVGMSVTAGDKQLLTPFEIVHKAQNKELEDYFETVAGARYEEMYHNPIRTGMFPDPSIVRVGEDYYMVNSSFIFFPCIPISHSKDLIHWEIIGHAITNPEWSKLGELEGGRGYWAPDISYDDGVFYITATYRLNDTGTTYRKQIVVTSKTPEGPYSEPVFLDEDGIDPSIFHEDEHHYMLLNRGARIFEINKEGTAIIGEPKLLYYGDHKRAPEGPHLLKKDGYYYLFLAEGGTGMGHRITVARSKTLFGNYEPCPYNPIMRQEEPEAGIQRCGHGKPVCTQNGEWYMVYLCARTVEGKYSILGRETALDPITWTADGWPIVNNRKGPSVLQKRPKLPVYVMEEETYKPALNPVSKDFMFPREPQPDAIRYDGDVLLLKGSNEPLSSVGSRNLLLRRQTAFSFTMSVDVLFAEMEEGQEVGITGYYDENTWVCLAISRDLYGYYMQVKEHIGREDRMHKAVRLNAQPRGFITLIMEVNYLHRDFYAVLPDGTKQQITELPKVYYLCDEGIRHGKRFTGAMAGIYAYGGEKEFYGGFRDFHYEVSGV